MTFRQFSEREGWTKTNLEEVKATPAERALSVRQGTWVDCPILAEGQWIIPPNEGTQSQEAWSYARVLVALWGEGINGYASFPGLGPLKFIRRLLSQSRFQR